MTNPRRFAPIATPAVVGTMAALLVLMWEQTVRTPSSDVTLSRCEHVGRYVIRRLIGRGAMGEVYRALDPELGRKVAIKVVRPGLRWGAGAAEARAGLLREARAMARICDPNVLAVYDVGTFDDGIFIAMEFVEGHTLATWLAAAPRSWLEVLDAFLKAGHGLAAAHAKNVVHHDFKPDNVMMGRDGGVRVMDFGLARELRRGVCRETQELRPLDMSASNDPEQSGPEGPRPDSDGPPASGAIPPGREMRGTPAYMSAEQFLGGQTDARTDQFSFCVALFEALYNVRPFQGHTVPELRGNVFQGRVVTLADAGSIPTAIRRVLVRGLRPDPALRWPSMDVLLERLDAAAQRRSVHRRLWAIIMAAAGR
jgi:serine/threonine protein kinase